ncbi:MAG: non-ribosomal peptide synthetase [Chloroflexi bacterium]|nr:non-ribosomal peptide synthetase [Chloroflexota bacterium]
MNTDIGDMDRIPASQQAIIDKCFHPTRTFVPFEREAIEQSIPDRFEQMVRMYPHRLAVKAGDEELTYDELNRAANRIAHAVLGQRGEGSEPIALLFERGVQAIAAIMGVLKAGKFYVSLDPNYPSERLGFMLDDSQSALTVTNGGNLALAKRMARGEGRVLNLDELDSSLRSDNLSAEKGPDSLAYIIYTSGSTGQPKGVFDNHRNLLHHIMSVTNEFHLGMEDRQTLLRSHGFNGALRDIFGSLLNGGSVHSFIVEEEGLDELADFLVRERITVYRSVVSLFRQFASTLTEADMFPDLRLIHVGGERVYRADIDLFKAHFSPKSIFLNGLGITETCTARHYYIDQETQITDDIVPVGYPVEDKQVLLLDDAGDEVGVGRVGEIAIKSRYLSLGYWNRPELTRARFVSAPESGARIYLTGDLGRKLPDGCLIHLGRKDFQVKTRGHRVELVEIEKALIGEAGMREAVVVATQRDSVDTRLLAYVVPHGDDVPSVEAIRRALSDILPEYMVPSTFVVLESLPLDAGGKVDRRALPEPEKGRPNLEIEFAAPRTPVEVMLSEIWAEALDLDEVGINDSFFDLGGHSLMASHILSRAIKTFRVELPLKALFESPTVAEMAIVITEHQAKKVGRVEIHQMLSELDVLTDRQARELLSE